jgi:PAS domain S-box-containing protein
MDNPTIPSEANLIAFAETCDDGVLVVLGEVATIVYCNQKLASLTGYQIEDVTGRSIKNFIHPEAFDQVFRNYRDRMEGKDVPEIYETTAIGKNGITLPIEVRGTKITWRNEPAGLIILRDITERRRLKDQINIDDEMLGGMMEGIATDSNGLITYVGSQANRLTGWQKEDLLGHSVFEHFPPEFLEKAQEMHKLFLAQKDYAGECSVICKDGSIKKLWVFLKPIVNKDGEVIGVVGLTADLKEHRGDNTAGASQPEDYVKQEALEYYSRIKRRVEMVRQQLGRIDEALSEDKLLVSLGNGFERKNLEPETQISQGTPGTEMTHLEVFCLSVLRVTSSGKQVQRWQSKRAKAVFEYLIARRGSPVSRDILMETLWPGSDPEAAANNLRLAIHSLRQTLLPLLNQKKDFQSILFSEGGYLINPEIHIVIDVEEFEYLWDQGRGFEKDGKTAEAIQVFKAAEILYHGDYLEDEIYEEWTITQRESLKDTYLLILAKLADYSMNQADYESCITYCQKTLRKDPCREDIYRRLMACFSRLGQKNRALQWFETCRRTMKTELDALPEHKTTELYSRLLKGEKI